MIELHKNSARQFTAHANEAVRLLRMSKRLHEVKLKGLIDAANANEAILKLNAEAVAEIETALRQLKKDDSR